MNRPGPGVKTDEDCAAAGEGVVADPAGAAATTVWRPAKRHRSAVAPGVIDERRTGEPPVAFFGEHDDVHAGCGLAVGVGHGSLLFVPCRSSTRSRCR